MNSILVPDTPACPCKINTPVLVRVNVDPGERVTVERLVNLYILVLPANAAAA